jgi:hypothetical protein
VWLDRRHDEQNIEYHCCLSQSTDGGLTWSPNVQVSTEPSNPLNAFPTNMTLENGVVAGEENLDARHLRQSTANQEALATKLPQRSVSMAGLLGEYIGVVSWSGVPTPIWTDIRNLHQDVFVGYLEGLGGVEWPTPADYANSLVIVPNPVHASQGVTVWSGAEGPGILSIHDAMGRTILTMEDVQSANGRLTFRSDEIGDAAGGIYFLRLTTTSGSSHGKLMLLE